MLYSIVNCIRGKLTVFDSTGNDSSIENLQQIGSECGKNFVDVIGSETVAIPRYVGIPLVLMFLALALYRLNFLRKQSQSLLSSTPFVAYCYIAIFNIAMVFTFSDQNSASAIYPVGFVFVYTCIVYICLYSMLVIVVYNILYSVFKEFQSKADADFWLKPKYRMLVFGHIIIVSFVSLFPSSSKNFQGFQSLLSTLEILFLGSFGVWFGIKVLRQIVKHQKATQQNYKRAILKIQTLLATTILAVGVSSAIFLLKAVETFKGITSETVLLTESDVRMTFWRSFVFMLFLSLLSNCLAFVTFNCSKSGSQKATNAANSVGSGVKAEAAKKSNRDSDGMQETKPSKRDSV